MPPGRQLRRQHAGSPRRQAGEDAALLGAVADAEARDLVRRHADRLDAVDHDRAGAPADQAQDRLAACVVRPAPLRPSRVTTSPLLTVRSTPCRTCDSPYQAVQAADLERRDAATSVAPGERGVGGAHVGLDHLRVRCDTSAYGPSARIAPRCSTVIVSAMRATTLMLCSTISTVRLAATFLISCVHPVDVLVAHALRRLVEQHQLGLDRERGGDLERALAAVGAARPRAASRTRSRPTVSQQRHRPVVERRRATARASRSGTRCRARAAARCARSRAPSGSGTRPRSGTSGRCRAARSAPASRS